MAATDEGYGSCNNGASLHVRPPSHAPSDTTRRNKSSTSVHRRKYRRHQEINTGGVNSGGLKFGDVKPVPPTPNPSPVSQEQYEYELSQQQVGIANSSGASCSFEYASQADCQFDGADVWACARRSGVKMPPINIPGRLGLTASVPVPEEVRDLSDGSEQLLLPVNAPRRKLMEHRG